LLPRKINNNQPIKIKIINKDRHGAKYAPLYYLFSWGIPMVGLVILAVMGKFGYTRGYTWCFIVEDNDFAFQIWGFYSIILTTMGAGLIMIIIIIYKISVIQRNAGFQFTAAMRYYWRSVLFIILYAFSFLTLCSYRFVLKANNQEYEDAFINYTFCILADNMPCQLSSQPSLGFWYFHTFVASTTGLWVALFFGVTQPYNYIFWQRYYYKITGQKEKLEHSRAAHKNTHDVVKKKVQVVQQTIVQVIQVIK